MTFDDSGKIISMAAKLYNETYVQYHGNITEKVKKKVTQTKRNYDQF